MVLLIMFIFQHPKGSWFKELRLLVQETVTSQHCQDKVQGQSVKTLQTVMPSLQALRNSTEINKKVTQRYHELEDMAQLGSLDLLLQSLSQRMQKSQKAKVKWPQDLAFVGTLRPRLTYDQLSITQWLLGFLRIRQEEQDPLIRENMIEYLTELAQDACDYSWEVDNGAHSVVLHRMGDGVVHWSNIKDVQKIRTRYAQITSASSVCQLYVHLTHNHATQAFDRLKNCLDDVRKWLSANKLKLNPDKTEFILFGSRNVRTKLRKFFPVNILGNLLSPVDAIKNLGVWFDSDFSFSCHVRNTCKASFVHIRDLKRLRGYLTREAALLAANALVGSRLDYCNSLFRGLSALDIRRLQCVQNSLARIVANTTKYSHITPVRKSLHWLPVLHRSVFKTALLVYKFLHSGHPKYFEPFLKPRHSVYRTRRSQSDGVLLEVPHCASIYKSKKHFGLSFAYDAPRIWNDLPDDVRSAKSLSSFRKKLKTYLFEKAYPP